jgi:hypothetical protein
MSRRAEVEAVNCKTCRIEVEEAETSEPLSARTRAHTETCSACRDFLIERRSLRQLLGSLEIVAAPPDFDFRLRARLNATAGQENSRRIWWPGLAPGRSAIALAASLALVIGAWGIFNQINLNRPEATPSTEAVVNMAANESQPKGIIPASSIPQVDPIAEERAAHHDGDPQSGLTGATKRRPNVDPFRGRKLNGERTDTASDANDSDSEIRSIDFGGLNPSPQLYPTGIYNPAVDPNPSIIVPVRALAQPAKFSLLEAGRGDSLIFSLRNVTFGSEQLIERGEPSQDITPASEASDIW